MKIVFGLLPLLAGLSFGSETYCDARQNGTHCYAALGRAVNLQLVTEVKKDLEYTLYKNNTDQILKVKKNQSKLNDAVKDRASFSLIDGTFRLRDVIRSDGSAYRLDIYSGEKRLTTTGIQMSVEAPVSSPQLSPVCQHGEVVASCSSKGDSVQYIWTLDGNLLRDIELVSGNGTGDIRLRRGVSGHLTCSVQNHVSKDTVTVSISLCPGLTYINCVTTNGTKISAWLLPEEIIECAATTTAPSTAPSTVFSTEPSTKEYIITVAGSLAVVLSLLAAAVGFYFFQMKKKATKAPDNGDDQDVIYSDVRTVPSPRRKEEKKPELEVVYGQVKVSGRPRQTPVPPEDECVYAKVRIRPRQ